MAPLSSWWWTALLVPTRREIVTTVCAALPTFAVLCCAVLPSCHRVKALDLIQRDFVSLSEEPHSFPVADDLSQLLQQLYGSAAAALAMLSEQVRYRDKPAHSCAANEHILQVCRE